MKSGDDRWKKLRACDCKTCASPKMRRSFSAVRGMRTARSASHALAEAIRWLTGQMPQMRAISDGISENGRPSQNFSKSAELRDVKVGVFHPAVVIEVERDLGVAFDARNWIDADGLAQLRRLFRVVTHC